MIRSTLFGKATLWGPVLVVLLLTGGTLAHAQTKDGYDLSWWTADSGGQTHQAGGGYTLGGTVGQPDAGVLCGPGYTLTGGFWQSGADELAFHTLVLQMAGNGSGTVEQIPDDASLAHGTVVTLTAIADTGSSFTGWSGAVGNKTNPITLVMDTDKVVVATYTLNIHTLDISYAGNGSGLVSLNAPGGSYDYGTIITLMADANPGSSFIGWSGDAAGTANPVTLAMDADKAVTATFSTDQTGQLHRVYLPLVERQAP